MVRRKRPDRLWIASEIAPTLRQIRAVADQKEAALKKLRGPSLFCAAAVVILTILATTMAQRSLADLAVRLFFVDISGRSVDAAYYACGDDRLAGPFMSGGSAIDWRNQFAGGDAQVIGHWSNEDAVCKGPPLFYDTSKGWYRG